MRGRCFVVGTVMLLVGADPLRSDGWQAVRDGAASTDRSPASSVMVDYIVVKLNDAIITRRDVEVALTGAAREAGTDESPVSKANGEFARRILTPLDVIASGGDIDNRQRPALRATLRALADRTLLRQVASRELGSSHLDSIRAAVDRYYLRRREGARAGDAEVTPRRVGAEMDRRIFEALLRKNVSVDRDQVTPSTVRAYYDEHLDAFRVPARVTFRHLFLRARETPGEKEGRAHIMELRAKLLAGADFSQLAKQHSRGPRAAEGGHWQDVDPSTWRSELTGCLMVSPVGQVSDIVESKHGYHIVQILRRDKPHIKSFNEMQVRIEDHLYWRWTDDAIGSWLAEIAREAYVWSLLDLHGATLHAK